MGPLLEMVCVLYTCKNRTRERFQRINSFSSPLSILRNMVSGHRPFLTLKKMQSILKFVSVLESEDGSSSRKMMRRANNDKVENAVFTWFVQKRSQGQPISGPVLCEKALLFNEMLNGPPDFKASTGWLRNFKARHGIRELEIHGEKMSSDTSSAANWVATFRAKIEEENYDPDFLYNADETGLCWKA